MLMPQEKGKHTWLVCPDCGHYRKLKKEEDYKISSQKKESGKGEVAVIEEEKKRKIKQPEYDIDTDAYSEMYEDY